MTDWDDPQLSALYRRAPRHEPARRSDELILAAARHAVARPYRRPAVWALAATLVLGVGIGWQLLTTQPSLPGLDAPATLESASPVEPTAREKAAVGVVRPRQAPLRGGDETLSDRAPPAAPKREAMDNALRQAEPRASVAGSAAPARAASGVCDEASWLPEGATREDWLAAIARARAAGDSGLADCLVRRFEQLFAGGHR